jgi:DNA-binding MarR family transcriptional regulator
MSEPARPADPGEPAGAERPDLPGDGGDPGTAAAARRLSVAITRLRSRLREEGGMHRTGLSISQQSVLARLVSHGPATAAHLAVAEHVSPQSIAQNLAVLKAAGLVRGERDPDDARKNRIIAKEAGAELVASISASRESFLVRAIDQLLAPEERTDLDRLVELLERFAAADLGRGEQDPAI